MLEEIVGNWLAIGLVLAGATVLYRADTTEKLRVVEEDAEWEPKRGKLLASSQVSGQHILGGVLLWLGAVALRASSLMGGGLILLFVGLGISLWRGQARLSIQLDLERLKTRRLQANAEYWEKKFRESEASSGPKAS
jgi:hypothetical protein